MGMLGEEPPCATKERTFDKNYEKFEVVSFSRSYVCLDRYHAQFRGDCIHIRPDALDQEMIVTTLIRCPRARLRLEYDDKSCASSGGPKVVCS